MPRVSVIIPTANRPLLVVRSVRSVLAQTYQNLEVIVVDDGMAASAQDAIRDIGDPRVRYFRNERNLGGGATRNRGVREAKGEYVAFQDDDDEWLPHKLEKQMLALAAAPADVAFAYGGVLMNYGDKEIHAPTEKGVQDLFIRALSRFKGFLTVTLVIKKKIFDEVGGFDESLPSHQDPELVLRITRKYRGVGIPEPLVRVEASPTHEHVGGSLDRRIRGREIVIEKHKELFCQYPKILAYHYFQLGLWCRDSGNRVKAKQYFWKSFLLAPSARGFLHAVTQTFLSMPRSVKTFLGVLVALGMIAILARRLSLESVLMLVPQIDPYFLLGAVVLVLLGHGFAVLRWRYMLSMMGYSIPLKRLFLSFFANIPATKVFPSYSGDFLRTAYLRDVVPPLRHAGAIGVEALLDIFALAVFVLGALILEGTVPWWVAIALILLLLVGGSLAFSVFCARMLAKISYFRAHHDIIASITRKKTFLVALSLSMIPWLCNFIAVLMVFSALHAPIPLATILAIQPLIVFATLLPVTPGGLGIRETGMVAGYASVAGHVTALLAGIAVSIVSIVIVPLLSIPFLISFLVTAREKQKAENVKSWYCLPYE